MVKLSAILLLGVLAIKGLAFEHKCTHDSQDFQEPDLIDVEEDFNPNGNDHSGRTLASYSNFRTYVTTVSSLVLAPLTATSRTNLFPPFLTTSLVPLRSSTPSVEA